MPHAYNQDISRNTLYCNHKLPAARTSSLTRLVKKAATLFTEKKITQIRELCLTTLALAITFVAVSYLFLCQLATYGW